MRREGLAVELRGVGLAYGDRRVLEGIDLAIAPGEAVCLVGPNGAGKTSLLRCLTGLAEAVTGEVRIAARPVRDWERRALARAVAVVPGQVELPFSMRVEDVVAMGRIPHEHPLAGPGPADHLAVEAAIERVGIGYLRGRDARQLSMGERQLVLLAMALAQGGGLLVLDEPTVHLDLRHQVEVLTLLAELSSQDGLTVVAVLHDLALAAHFFARLVLIHGGRLVADGPAAEVLAPERVRRVYGVDPRFVPSLAA